ncbi:hypothetical protein R1sor_010370 [Riccia sorocarpa]|uniref:Uncharacterized protein n=1 Tax=Riccia sorocarpa TaxID=122646 RepID=A0ABD3HZQ9_9MARC
MRYWTAEEALLLLPTIPSANSITGRHLIKSWMAARKHLCLDHRDLELPAAMTLKQLSLLMSRYWRRDHWCEKTIFSLLKRLKISMLGHLKDGADGPSHPGGAGEESKLALGRRARQLVRMDQIHRFLEQNDKDRKGPLGTCINKEMGTPARGSIMGSNKEMGTPARGSIMGSKMEKTSINRRIPTYDALAVAFHPSRFFHRLSRQEDESV